LLEERTPPPIKKNNIESPGGREGKGKKKRFQRRGAKEEWREGRHDISERQKNLMFPGAQSSETKLRIGGVGGETECVEGKG